MRIANLLALGTLAVITTACPFPTAPRVRGVSGGAGGSGDHLGFITEPSSAVAGVTIAPAIQVAALDSLGEVDSTFSGGITLSLGSTTAGAVLSGTTTVVAASGVASFGDLSVDQAGTGYTLTASASGFSGVGSAAFDITTAAASVLQGD